MLPEKHICFITPGHLASNPRLVKEAEAATHAGYRVSILMSQYLSDLSQTDAGILAAHPDWKVYVVRWVGDTVRERYTRAISGLRSRLSNRLAGSMPFSLLADGAVSRLLLEQLRLAKKIRASFFIAHNLGALPVAARAANYHGVKYAFDAEDYHRGEVHDEYSQDALLKKKVEDGYLPAAAYVSAASPLIALQYASHYPAKRVITINNVFSVTYQQSLDARNNRQGLKLFWFSQTVGLNRGLEEVIQAMGLLQKKDIQLTLLGHCTDQQRRYFENLGKQQGLAEGQIIFMSTVPPEEVFAISRSHDIGLALEVPHCTNRNICLTNKIFTYLIAGNAIITSETRAQKLFMDTHPGVGLSFPVGDIDRLAGHLNFFYQNRDALEAYRKSAWQLAKEELNWEKEQGKFLEVVEGGMGG